MKKLLNIKGQISIFFATTVLVLITFIAFIINIGVFVKAKMNLQNAVDAAAYAGAAVQARQLTNIGYLNWEMRNVYKEWLFKQYILGNLNLNDVISGASANTDLRMEPYNSGTADVMDGYNIPSACVDYRASGNVSSCAKAMVPGLPRFSSTNVLGMEETMDTFMDAIAGSKAKNCSDRTKINYLTSFVWAYNIPGSGATQAADAPDVLTDRPGAFPTAFEMAFRMRQLEAQVNKKPYDQGVCLAQGVNCSDNINSLVSNEITPSNERVYKAFYSAFRNLGAQDCGENSNDEFKCFFTLSELPPTLPSQLGPENSLSNILIPPGPARDKYYLDLKLQSVNYASFFTMLAPNTVGIGQVGSFVTSGVAADSTAECVSTKVGIPVPGYPLGFVKSPDVITYYAVKGQTRFIGRFSPFANNSLTLTAYAAAKPFGGRIGPMLFDANTTAAESLRPRMNDQGLSKSSPYATGIDNSTMVDRFGNVYTNVSNGYAPGVPIPLGVGDERFFVTDETDVIGGNNGIAPLKIFFSIPNMVYDYPQDSPSDFSSYGSDNAIQIYNATNPTGVTAGLYNGQIFNKLRANLTGVGGATISVTDIANAVYKARSPTLYDAHHYLVPTPEVSNDQFKVDSYGYITTLSGQIEGRNMYDMMLYAPLISDVPDSIYTSVSQLVQIASSYLENQEQAVLKYRGSMNQAAWSISNDNRSTRNQSDIGFESSQIISNFDEALLNTATVTSIKSAAPGCDSVTGSFVYFFIGTGISGNNAVIPTNCDPANRLINMLEAKWNSMDGELESKYYIEKYLDPESDSLKRALYSAYRPTQMNDADDQGVWKNFTNGASMNMWRNSYSTKFVTLKSLSNREDNFYQSSNFAIFSEGSMTQGAVATDPQVNFANILSVPVQSDFSKIRH